MKTANGLGFLQDGSGDFSATRLAFLVWGVFVLAVWCYVSVFVKKDLSAVPESAGAAIEALPACPS